MNQARLRVVGPGEPAVNAPIPPDEVAAAQRERERIVLELELAEERRQMRRALAAKLVDEFRTRPGEIPVRALRTAVIERDLTEEECERLRATLAKLERDTSTAQTKPDKR